MPASCGSIRPKRAAAPGVVAVFMCRGHGRGLQADHPVLADGELLRDADFASGVQQGAICRRGRRRRVAEDRYLAEDALELIDIEYEPLGAITDPRSWLHADGAPLLHEEAGTNVLIAREFKKGDVRGRSRRPRAFSVRRSLRDDAKGRRWRWSRAAIRPNTKTGETPSRSTPPRTFPASCATRSRTRLISRAPPAGDRAGCRRQLRLEGLALSGRNPAVCIVGAQACAGRSSGPATGWKTSAAAARPSPRSSMPRWALTRTASRSGACRPT